MTEQERKDAYKRWLQQSERLARITSEDRMESPQERKRNIARALRDYGYFCQRYLKHYCECPNAGFHNDAARYMYNNDNCHAVFKWPRAMPRACIWISAYPCG